MNSLRVYYWRDPTSLAPRRKATWEYASAMAVFSLLPGLGWDAAYGYSINNKTMRSFKLSRDPNNHSKHIEAARNALAGLQDAILPAGGEIGTSVVVDNYVRVRFPVFAVSHKSSVFANL